MSDDKERVSRLLALHVRMDPKKGAVTLQYAFVSSALMVKPDTAFNIKFSRGASIRHVAAVLHQMANDMIKEEDRIHPPEGPLPEALPANEPRLH